MSEMPSPVLILGDTQLGKNTVVKAKKKYGSYYWQTVDASKQSCDEIRMLSGFQQFGYSKKVVLITEIPNRKQVREFIADLVQSSSENTKFVIWDSSGIIKVDAKKGISKTWQDWINVIKENKGAVVVNSGGDFAENDSKNSVCYVQDLFLKRKRDIDNVSAKIFVDLVGKKRALLYSEVEKLCLIAPRTVTREFILEHTFPSSKEAVLYKFGNDLDSNSYGRAISSLENFIQLGTNANVLAQIIATKARWHLVICDLWNQGLDWNSIRYEILKMGKFPSCVWHNDQLTEPQKKNLAMELSDPHNMKNFMVQKMGLPEHYLSIPIPKKINKVVKRGEIVPLPFIGDMMITYTKSGIVAPNRSKYSEKELKQKVLDRALNVYTVCTDNLKQIRYSYDDQSECLHEMVRVWTNQYI